MDKDRIVGTAKEFAGKAEGAVGDMTDDKQTQASGRAREAAGAVQDLYGQAKDTVRDAADTAASYAKDAYEHRGETIRSGQKAMTQAVHDNPVGALLIAGGIGFALALLMSRQPRRPPPRWRYYG
ncbi:CsbD family protein [Bradyrhizobium sp. WSM 1704]|uniref:CsbD family protein n=1 Tax=Bradyrhizobium semiaridum TaxID=2821404 RepID=UPI001CE26844|nr:CsbD family protein [Bradyrhizobium semiaridum]MCA6124891.1 CsbD family protein [Bradyrhizobium semiaridum]